MRVIKVSGCGVEVKEIGEKLEDLQKEVGGYIECVYPWEDMVGVICNEDGKMEGLEPTMALCDDGELFDIVCGDCLIVGLTEDNFGSLTDELLDKYIKVANKLQDRMYLYFLTRR